MPDQPSLIDKHFFHPNVQRFGNYILERPGYIADIVKQKDAVRTMKTQTNSLIEESRKLREEGCELQARLRALHSEHLEERARMKELLFRLRQLVREIPRIHKTRL